MNKTISYKESTAIEIQTMISTDKNYKYDDRKKKMEQSLAEDSKRELISEHEVAELNVGAQEEV